MDRKEYANSKKINLKFLKNKQGSDHNKSELNGLQNNSKANQGSYNSKTSFASQVLSRPKQNTATTTMQNKLHSTENQPHIAKERTLNSTLKAQQTSHIFSSETKQDTTHNDLELFAEKNKTPPVIVDHYKTLNENLAAEKSKESQLMTGAEPSILDKINNGLKNFQLMKFLSNKNNKIASVVVIMAIVLVIMLNLSKKESVDSGLKTQNFNATDYVSSNNYIRNLENSLTNILSNIEGAGKVSVMVTLESGPELKIATNLDERTTTTTSGQNASTVNVNVIKNPILITQNGKSAPLVLMEIMPKIKGVIVVAQGANNTKVKLQLLQAVQALLEVPNNNIQIYSGI